LRGLAEKFSWLFRPAGDQGYVLTRKAEQLIGIEAERKE
tara:strand:+ start:64 stop:180 length:117 start_codon:yes stop_codon:yes gene_type:complete